jgi:hypothetical protein
MSNTAHSFLAQLGELIAAEGIHAGCGDLLLVAGAAGSLAPAASEVLIDPDQPDVARNRAYAVASAAVLRDAVASALLRQALIDDIVPHDPYVVAA